METTVLYRTKTICSNIVLLCCLGIVMLGLSGCQKQPPVDVSGAWWALQIRPNLGREELYLILEQPRIGQTDVEIVDGKRNKETSQPLGNIVHALMSPQAFQAIELGFGDTKTPKRARSSGVGTVDGSKFSLKLSGGPSGPSGWETAEFSLKLKVATTPKDVEYVMNDFLSTFSDTGSSPTWGAKPKYKVPDKLEYLEGRVIYSGTRVAQATLPAMGATYGEGDGTTKPMTSTVDLILIRPGNLEKIEPPVRKGYQRAIPVGR